VHQTSSKHTITSKHGRFNKSSPNQEAIAGKNRAHSGTNRAGRSEKKAERVEKPRPAKAADISRVKRVNMQFLAHPRGHDSTSRQKIQEIKPQISGIQVIRRESLAAERECWTQRQRLSTKV
jgi:hypothetical protein